MAKKRNAEATLRAAVKEAEAACAVAEAALTGTEPQPAAPERSAKRSKRPQILTPAQLKKIVDMVPDDRRLLAKGVADELSFMSEMLAALKDKAREIGALEYFVQGTQCLLRENPALKSYNTTIKNYAVLLSKLTDLLPKAAAVPDEPDTDEFDDFVAGRDAD